jgi:hypothetical protein
LVENEKGSGWRAGGFTLDLLKDLAKGKLKKYKSQGKSSRDLRVTRSSLITPAALSAHARRVDRRSSSPQLDDVLSVP